MRVFMLTFCIAVGAGSVAFGTPVPLDRQYPVPQDQAAAVRAFEAWFDSFPRGRVIHLFHRSSSVPGKIHEEADLLRNDPGLLVGSRFQFKVVLDQTADGLLLHVELEPGSVFGLYPDQQIQDTFSQIADGLPSQITGVAQ